MNIWKAVSIRAVRKDLSIADIERKANIANGTIGGWRKGRPYADTLRKVANVLGCTMDELMDEAEKEE